MATDGGQSGRGLPGLERAAGCIGFGCAHLYGGSDRAGSLRLLDAALDAGITYFDTARLYGHGQSESLLGEVVARRRDRLVITGKAGILPVATSLTHRVRSKVHQVAHKAARPFGGFIAEPKPDRPTFGVFAPRALRRSVETSLRALRTDYLDCLLLHECTEQQARDPAVLSLLGELVREGKIRSYGSATQPATTIALAAAPPEGLHALQFKSDFVDATRARVAGLAPGRFLVTHSHLGRAFAGFLSFIDARHHLYPAQLEALDIAPGDHTAWGNRMLAFALSANRAGVVLFSSTRPDNIARAAVTPPLTGDAQGAMQALVEAYKAHERIVG